MRCSTPSSAALFAGLTSAAFLPPPPASDDDDGDDDESSSPRAAPDLRARATTTSARRPRPAMTDDDNDEGMVVVVGENDKANFPADAASSAARVCGVKFFILNKMGCDGRKWHHRGLSFCTFDLNLLWVPGG
jgi:hypothetical protein